MFMKKPTIKKMEQDVLRYFLDYTSFTQSSKGYGLTPDHSLNVQRASIAATGFMFPALILAFESEMIDKAELKQKVLGTLQTLENVETFHGFFPHFLDMNTGQRFGRCEYSTIDTTLMLYGLLAIDQYMKDDVVHNLVLSLLYNVDWETFVDDQKKYLNMAYNPDKLGDYVTKEPGFISRWDMFAEQLIMYILIAGLLEDEELSRALYSSFTRHQKDDLIYPPHNTLFIYHMPLCFVDLRNTIDPQGINWVENARLGTLSHIHTSQQYKNDYPTFAQGFFGMNASDNKKGYRVFGALPNIENKVDTDGTIAPYSIIGSLPYVPETTNVLDQLFDIPNLYQQHGFMDAFQLDRKSIWISPKYISIDKGIELLTFEQLSNDLIRQLIMSHPIIKRGFTVLQFQESVKKEVMI